MFDRSRTWALALFGLRDMRNRKLPTDGHSSAISLMAFSPSTQSIQNNRTGAAITPVFTISGNTVPVTLLYRRLSGRAVSISYSKNGGSFVTATNETPFNLTFNDGDTLQLYCIADGVIPGNSIMRIENITDDYKVCSTNLTIQITVSSP